MDCGDPTIHYLLHKLHHQLLQQQYEQHEGALGHFQQSLVGDEEDRLWRYKRLLLEQIIMG
jgi:hypothetical protein